jgi:hypothetical protein
MEANYELLNKQYRAALKPGGLPLPTRHCKKEQHLIKSYNNNNNNNNQM